MSLQHRRELLKKRANAATSRLETSTGVPAKIKSTPDGKLIIIVEKKDFSLIDFPGDDWNPPTKGKDYYDLIVD